MATTKCEIEFEENKVYLIKYFSVVQEVFVEKITDTAYKLRKQRSDGTWYIEWILKPSFKINNTILEYLYTLQTPPSLENKKNQIIVKNEDLTKECPICFGDKHIYDPNSTTCKRTCPKCNGTGRIFK